MNLPTQNLLSQAAKYCEAGDLQSAKTILTKLSKDLNNPIAMEMLAIVHIQQKEFEQAIDLFKKILKKDSNNLRISYNLAKAYEDIKNYQLAVNLYKKILDRDKNQINVLINLANCLYQISKFEECIQILERVSELDPTNINIHNRIGTIYRKAKDFQEAINNFQKVLSLDQKNIDAINGIGLCFFYQKKYEKSIEKFNQAIEINSSHAETWLNLGLVLFEQQKFGDSINASTNALKFNPFFAEAWSNIGNVHLVNDEYAEAEKSYTKALEIEPNNNVTKNNLFITYSYMGKRQEAYDLIKDESENHLKNPDMQYLYGQFLLANNDFLNGWTFFEARFQSNLYKDTFIPKKDIWNGEKKSNILLIIGDQGIGDQILYSSMLNELEAYPQKIIIAVSAKLIPLMTRSFKHFKIIGHNNINEINYDNYIFLSSLGKYFRKNLFDFDKSRRPHLIANEKKVHEIKSSLKAYGKKICGISWKSLSETGSNQKSIPTDYLIPLFKQNFIFVNLQYGLNNELYEIESKYNVNIISYEGIDLYDDIDGVAALIESCDLIITSSNTNAHLAGALNKKTLLLIPEAYGRIWYWSLKNLNSLWYPSIKIFTKKISYKWDSVVSAVIKHINLENGPH